MPAITSGTTAAAARRRDTSTVAFGHSGGTAMLDASTLHRGAKYFMDSGRAATHDEAMALLQSFGLTIHVGASVATSRDEQVALADAGQCRAEEFSGGRRGRGLAGRASRSRV